MNYKKDAVALMESYLMKGVTEEYLKTRGLSSWKAIYEVMSFLSRGHSGFVKIDPDKDYVRSYYQVLSVPDYAMRRTHVFSMTGVFLFSVSGVDGLPWTLNYDNAKLYGTLLTQYGNAYNSKLVETEKGFFVRVWLGAFKTPANFGCVGSVDDEIWTLKE